MLMPSRNNFCDRVLDLLSDIPCEELESALEDIAATFNEMPPKFVDQIMLRIVNNFRVLTKYNDPDFAIRLSFIRTLKRMFAAMQDQ